MGSSLRKWHRILGLTKQQPISWHRDRLREELSGRRTATTRWQQPNETSDVLFSLSQARHDGFPLRLLPSMLAPQYMPVYAYMLVKYTSRWSFYRVVNPRKIFFKVDEVALRHGIDQARFRRVS
ncbi:hypothetical protein C8Q69DRAFT_491611 [Paecilomyces variotii]|uniref:Uncharacterized protein n=1 Tax=Byssochlamys spectabilis TaxID=264951 RepID=A0A443HU96_BYSSP|nr:hypothetical protein C8Q69DRAFT_491611 [Paecilomyces variotii]RWQ95389.1 hypothetical protein C8Q69DRAFT_491611 [Paecilomyces variotii]